MNLLVHDTSFSHTNEHTMMGTYIKHLRTVKSSHGTSSEEFKLKTSFRQSGKLIVNEAVRTDWNLSVATTVEMLVNYTECSVYTLYIVHNVVTLYIMYTVFSFC